MYVYSVVFDGCMALECQTDRPALIIFIFYMFRIAETLRFREFRSDSYNK